jgi:heat-inducible transcriptional repressor
MEQKLGGYRDLVGPILRIVYEVVSQLSEYELNVDGVSNLLEYPEFSDAVRARELVRLVEEKQELIEKMTYDPQKKLNVYIGTEDGRLDGASFIVRPFSLESGVTGAVGLIGPKRMNYSRAIAKLDYITTRIISDDGDDSGEERIKDERKEDI